MDFLDLFHFAASACSTSSGLFPSLYDGLCNAKGEIEITSMANILHLITNAIRVVTAFGGAIAVIMVLVAAIYYITSTGDPGRVKKAKDILINLITGLVIISMAYAATTFVSSNL